MSLDEPRTVLVTGIQAAGKSTVGRLLASRFRRGAFIEGDQLWQMVVAGRADMADPPSPEALHQLELRYRHGALLASSFVEAGFVAVHVDNIYGPAVARQLEAVRGPRSLIVLRPRPEVVAAREAARPQSAYAGWVTGGRSLLDAVTTFDRWLAETPPIGLWVDSSDQTPEETVEEIMARWSEAAAD